MLGDLPAPGVHGPVELRREDVGLPVPRAPVRPYGRAVNGPANEDLRRLERTVTPQERQAAAASTEVSA